jgi:hypothetical protein
MKWPGEGAWGGLTIAMLLIPILVLGGRCWCPNKARQVAVINLLNLPKPRYLRAAPGPSFKMMLPLQLVV